ncbi:MAG: bestrophin family ion channel [Cyanobacteria bacterium J06554_11]
MTRLKWFLSAFRLQGSILPRILPRMMMFCSAALVIVATYKQELWVDSDNLKALTGNVACNLVLGLLLVFRTNTAYERFWEGRKAWGTLVITTRNLAREIHIAVDCPTDNSKAEKEKALNRLVSFAITVKCQLRNECPSEELGEILDKEDVAQLKKANRPPQLITFWLSHYLKHQEIQGHIDMGQRIDINARINQLVEGLSGCERILKTPMPLSYGIYLKRLTLLYCFLLPLGLAEQLGWWTVAAIALVSFVLLGVEEIGNEIEDPFGYDFNDLKLDSICATLQQDILSVLSFSEEGYLADEPALCDKKTPDKTEPEELAAVTAA